MQPWDDIGSDFSICRGHRHLNLGGNGFSGSIPPSFSALSSLQDLLLPSNQLSSSLPTELTLLTGLKYATTVRLHTSVCRTERAYQRKRGLPVRVCYLVHPIPQRDRRDEQWSEWNLAVWPFHPVGVDVRIQSPFQVSRTGPLFIVCLSSRRPMFWFAAVLRFATMFSREKHRRGRLRLLR